MGAWRFIADQKGRAEADGLVERSAVGAEEARVIWSGAGKDGGGPRRAGLIPDPRIRIDLKLET
jgi:hypothetical protein